MYKRQALLAAYISVPRDLTKVKSKVAFNLTKRQLICFGTAALIGVPLFFLLRDSGGNSAATQMCIRDRMNGAFYAPPLTVPPVFADKQSRRESPKMASRPFQF